MAASTRDRIMETTAELFRRHGYTGTGMKQIVEAANAPFGSLYHHFPGGKEELGEEVIRSSGAMYYELWEMIAAQAPDVVGATADFFSGAAAVLEATDYVDACPIETVALEVASTNDRLRRATAEVFESWIAGISSHLEAAGMEPARARAVGIEVINALEGAFVLSRAMRSTEPLEVSGASAAASVAAALAG
jgi:AcrR family transcriptional regulator